MCGIAGIARFDGQVTSRDVTGVLRMMDAQVHRGPDDWGLLLPEAALRNTENRAVLERRGMDHVRTYVASAPAVVLGSRRLSIIDLSRWGRMPMGNADGRVWITYNGEICNTRELQPNFSAWGIRSSLTPTPRLSSTATKSGAKRCSHASVGCLPLPYWIPGSCPVYCSPGTALGSSLCTITRMAMP